MRARRAAFCVGFLVAIASAACEKDPPAEAMEGVEAPAPAPSPRTSPAPGKANSEQPAIAPRTVSIAVLEAFKQKDVPRLLALSSAATRALGPQLQPGDRVYEGMFGHDAWRMRAVESFTGEIEQCRIRDEEAQCLFGTPPGKSVFVVVLSREEGLWRFRDFLSPPRVVFDSWGTATP